MKKIVSILLSVFVVSVLVACSSSSVEADSYYVAIDINPSIEFIVNKDDVVVSYNVLNEDAAALVAEIDFIGMNVDDAVELFVQMATEAGYIDVDADDNAVLVTVLGNDDNPIIEQVRNRIKERIGRFFVRNYIKGEVLSEDFTEEDLVNQAQELGVTPSKLALCLLIMDTDTTEIYVLSDLLEMPVKDLVQIVRTYHEDAFHEYTQEQLQQFAELREQRFAQYQERFNQYVANHPELTPEQVDAMYQQFQKHIRQTNRTEWRARIEQWYENHNQETADSTSEGS